MSYKVTGRLREAESGLGVPNLVVKVLDEDWRLDDELGGARTDAAGRFEITYEEENFRDLRLEREPDLYLIVRTPDSARVLYSSADQVRKEAGKAEHFEIDIDKETLGELAPQPPEQTTGTGEGEAITSSTGPVMSFEEIPDGEAEQIKEITQLTIKLLDKRYPAPKRILRGVHPKSHGCVSAVFEVNNDIDQDLQVGLFSNPGKTYSALIRYSNASSRVDPDVKDKKNKSRGMAVKVLDVGGEVLLDDNGAHHQDFLMITEPAFAFANVADYLRLTKVLHEHNDEAAPFFAPLNPQVPGFSEEERERTKRTLQLVGTLESTPVANLLQVQYFSAAPFLFGPDRVAKFSVRPCAGEKPQKVPENPSENYLHEALIDTMSRNEAVCFDFMVQARGKDEEGLNIENASTVWDAQQFPFIKVAKITIPAPQKDIDSPAAIERCERLEFTPWHSLVEHRPLGGINRLRKAVYLASQAHRASRTGTPDVPSNAQETKMTHVADYLAISDTGERLRGGDSREFEFNLPARADLDMDAVLALKVNASGSFERLSSNIEINGKQVLRTINSEESYQTLHEVVERGILVPGANKASVKVDDDERAGRGKVKFEDLVLWFKSTAATATTAEPVAPGLDAPSAAGITIDSGEFVTWRGKASDWKLWNGSGEREYREHIDFSQSFSEVPHVVASIHMLDIADQHNSRLRVEAENITQEGFDIACFTWADTQVWGVGVNWVAYGLGERPLPAAVEPTPAPATESRLVVSPGVVSEYLTIQDSNLEIKRNNYREFTFELPTGANVKSSAVLLYTGGTSRGESLKLKVTLNDKAVRSQSFYGRDWKTTHEIIQPGRLLAGNNELRFSVESSGRGDLTISDILLMYQQEVSVCRAEAP